MSLFANIAVRHFLHAAWRRRMNKRVLAILRTATIPLVPVHLAVLLSPTHLVTWSYIGWFRIPPRSDVIILLWQEDSLIYLGDELPVSFFKILLDKLHILRYNCKYG